MSTVRSMATVQRYKQQSPGTQDIPPCTVRNQARLVRTLDDRISYAAGKPVETGLETCF
jgi:hypothetical protein